MKKIVTIPHPILKKRASEVPVEEISSKKIQRILAIMKETLRSTTEGIGIAAPQIGHSLRIFLASEEALRWNERADILKNDEKKQWAYHTFINPVIKHKSKKQIVDAEGCLSVPNAHGIVSRSEKVTVEAHDEHGNKFQRGMTKLYARVMQHEIDHLDGILFIEKAKNIKKLFQNKSEA